uniref:Uncharacterized protein n=1 Tax=Vitis vinifera TaxID=29760 RepID=F6HNV8_VITVI
MILGFRVFLAKSLCGSWRLLKVNFRPVLFHWDIQQIIEFFL